MGKARVVLGEHDLLFVDPKREETDVDATSVAVSAARTNTVCHIRIIFFPLISQTNLWGSGGIENF